MGAGVASTWPTVVETVTKKPQECRGSDCEMLQLRFPWVSKYPDSDCIAHGRLRRTRTLPRHGEGESMVAMVVAAQQRGGRGWSWSLEEAIGSRGEEGRDGDTTGE